MEEPLAARQREGLDEPPPGRWLLYLLFRPRRFFRHFVIADLPFLTALAFYLFGIACVIDRIDGRLLRDQIQGTRTFAFVAESWATWWVVVLAGGVVSAAVVAAAGGWWYCKRLQLSGASAPRRDLARRVYVFASLVWAVPALSCAIWSSATYSSPRAAIDGDDAASLIPLVFLVWSLFTSYIGATTAFDLRRAAARLWFLILPGAAYLVVIGGILTLFAANFIAQEPDVRHPRRLQRPGFEVHYPGNWVIDERMPDDDPDGYFSIEPGFADCLVLFHLSDGRVLVVREICAADDSATQEPGLRHIRTTFAWR